MGPTAVWFAQKLARPETCYEVLAGRWARLITVVRVGQLFFWLALRARTARRTEAALIKFRNRNLQIRRQIELAKGKARAQREATSRMSHWEPVRRLSYEPRPEDRNALTVGAYRAALQQK